MKTSLSLLVLAALAQPAVTQSVTGTWGGEVLHPRTQQTFAFTMVLQQDDDGAVHGGVDAGFAESPLVGTFDAATGELKLSSTLGNLGRIDLELLGGELVGEISSIPIAAERRETAAPEIPSYWRPLRLPDDPPVTVDQRGLPDDLAAEFDRRILEQMRRQNLAGLSAAFVVDGRVVDVRSYGWQDVAKAIPATGASTYRWASISKPMTAIAALQLFERGELDLDADVRDYVPEFPAKPHPITSRQLLCHQGGIVHYTNGPVIRTVRSYDVPHPFADRVLALDMFKESPLVCEPGSQYSYSTPGYALLGAVIGRAGEQKYRDQVVERIATPLGMDTLQPDHEWVDIPQRTPGYRRAPTGEVFESTGSDKISWKLAAGGWTSTVGDLARFGAGVARGELLRPATWEMALTPQPTAAGEPTTGGLGFGVFELAGRKVAAHSGGQQKTSTYLIVDLEARTAVALMCNTQGARLTGPARELLQWLVD